MAQIPPEPTLDCMIVEQWAPPPSQTMSVREQQVTSDSCGRNRERTTESDHSPRQSAHKKKKVPNMEHFGSEDVSCRGVRGGGHLIAKNAEGIHSVARAKIFDYQRRCFHH